MKQIHYEDNIFFMHSFIKTLHLGLSLEVDHEQFANMLLTNIFLVNDGLSNMCNMIIANRYMIKRVELLRSLMRATTQFIELLDLCRQTKSLPSDATQHKKMENCHTIQAENMETIAEELRNTSHGDYGGAVVSEQEYSSLIHNPFDAQDEPLPKNKKRR